MVDMLWWMRWRLSTLVSTAYPPCRHSTAGFFYHVIHSQFDLPVCCILLSTFRRHTIYTVPGRGIQDVHTFSDTGSPFILVTECGRAANPARMTGATMVPINNPPPIIDNKHMIDYNRKKTGDDCNRDHFLHRKITFVSWNTDIKKYFPASPLTSGLTPGPGKWLLLLRPRFLYFPGFK